MITGPWWQGFKKLYKINIFQHWKFSSKPFHSLTLPSFPDEARTVPVTFHWTLQTYTKLKKKNETKYFKKEFDNCFIICNLFLEPTNHKAWKSNHTHPQNTAIWSIYSSNKQTFSQDFKNSRPNILEGVATWTNKLKYLKRVFLYFEGLKPCLKLV